MAEGGIRYDYTVEDHNLAWGEERTVRLVAVDSAGNPATLSGKTFNFFLTRHENELNGLTALLADAVTKITSGIDTGTDPNIDVPFVTATWPSGGPAVYWYECWQTAPVVKRWAYGLFPVL